MDPGVLCCPCSLWTVPINRFFKVGNLVWAQKKEMRGCYSPFWHAHHLAWTLLLLSARPATLCTMHHSPPSLFVSLPPCPMWFTFSQCLLPTRGWLDYWSQVFPCCRIIHPHCLPCHFVLPSRYGKYILSSPLILALLWSLNVSGHDVSWDLNYTCIVWLVLLCSWFAMRKITGSGWSKENEKIWVYVNAADPSKTQQSHRQPTALWAKIYKCLSLQNTESLRWFVTQHYCGKN